MPTPIDIAVMTVNRPQNYLDQTLASLFASGPEIWQATPIHLFLGSDDDSYLSSWKKVSSLRIHALPPQDWERITSWHVHRRLSFNLWRTLAFPSAAELGRCICEDDIVVRDGFYTKMLQAVEETLQREGPRFVLTLYSHYDYAADPQRRRGTWYCSYNALTHYGNCCFFVSAALLADLAEQMHLLGVEQDQAPADILLGRICEDLWQQGGGGMYQTVASLAQHRGFVSNGTSDHYSSSPTFARPWPVL